MAGHPLLYSVGLATVAVLMAVGPTSSLAQSVPLAAPAPGDTLHLGLAEAIGRALDDNLGLRAGAEQAHAADRAAAAAFRQHFGDLEAVAWASRFSDSQLVRPMSQALLAGGFANLPFAQDQAHYGLTYELPLFVGGKLVAASHLARLKADEASALLEGTRWQVRTNVTTTYAATQVLAAAAAAYGDEVASLEKTHARIELMVRQGKRPEVDLLKATDALAEAQAELADAQAERTHVRALLLALLDYPPDQTIALDSLPDRVATLPAGSMDWDALVQDAAAVTAAKLRVQQAASSKHLALGDFLPKLSVRGNLLEHAGSGVPGTLETWELTLQASVPVFTGGRHVAAYQSAAAGERAADLALQQTVLQQEAEIRGALASLEAANEGLDAARTRVAAAGEAARIEAVRYDNGAGTIEDLLTAQARAAAAAAFLAKAQGDVLGASARINALVEKEIVR
jgi:outer membrane protein